MPNNATPVRYPSGVSTDWKSGVLAQYGLPSPANYHTFFDDFDSYVTAKSAYTTTLSGNGTLAQAAGDGGLLTGTSNTGTPIATDLVAIQLPVAGFPITANKKQFFLCRLSLHDVVNQGLLAGFIQTTATPFTVVDGVYFLKASGASNNLILRSTVGSANTDYTIPTAYYTLTNDVVFDLGFEITRKGNVNVWIGTPSAGNGLVGYQPISGYNSQPGPHGGLIAPTLTAVNLNPTIAVRSGTTASSTSSWDFMLAAKER